MEKGWKRIPVIIRAVITGSVVCLVGTMGWSILLGLNLKFSRAVPWAVAVMPVLLWAYWRYLGGKGWPHSTAETRRASLRSHRLSRNLCTWALAAGTLSIASVVNFQLLYARFVRVPSERVPDLSRYPFLTVLGALLMSAVVSGLMEEAGFRGYMQVPIEQRYGPVTASSIVAAVFAFWHFSHGVGPTVPRLPYYFAISFVYSGVAYLSNSLLPVVAIHTCGDALEFLLVWLRGTPQQRPLVWQAGTDVAFWAELGLGVFLGILAAGAFRRLLTVSRSKRKTLFDERPDMDSLPSERSA